MKDLSFFHYERKIGTVSAFFVECADWRTYNYFMQKESYHSMKKQLLMTLAAAALLGLTACGGNGSSSSSASQSGSQSQSTSQSQSASQSQSTSTSQAPAVFDGGIADLEVGVAADVDGVVAQVLTKGFTLADGKGAVYVYGEDSAKKVKVGDYVHVEGEVSNYYGVYEISKVTVTAKEGNRGLDDIVGPEVEMTEAKVGELFAAIKACAGEGKTPYSVENQIPYKLTLATAVENGSHGGAFKIGDSKLLCPHYYVPANNRTEANRTTEINAGGKYDVFFYVAGTNSSQNLDIHIYDVVAHYDAVESVAFAVEQKKEVTVGEKLALSASVLPASADQALTWSVTSGETFASVDQDGKVSGLKAGEAVIRATSAAATDKYAEITVTVKEATVEYESIGKLSFDKNDQVVVEKGDKQITYTEGDVSIVIAQGSSTSTVNEWKSDYSSARWYKNHTAKITGKEAFVRAVITCSTESNGQYVPAEGESFGEGVTIKNVKEGAVTFEFSAAAAEQNMVMGKQIRVVSVELFKVKAAA